MSLRDGLKNLRAAREGEPGDQATAEVRASKSVDTPAPTTEKRETFSTRIRPSTRYSLKRTLLGIQESGIKIRMEDVIEQLILEYIYDLEFQSRINEKANRVERGRK